MYYLILDFKAKIFKRFHRDAGINSVWGDEQSCPHLALITIK